MTKLTVNNKTDTRKISYKSMCLLYVLNASICLNLSFLPRENQGIPPNLRNFLTGICSILFSYRNFKNFRLRGSHVGNFELLENSSRKFPHHLPPLRKFRLNEINEIKLKIVQLLLIDNYGNLSQCTCTSQRLCEEKISTF